MDTHAQELVEWHASRALYFLQGGHVEDAAHELVDLIFLLHEASSPAAVLDWDW